MIVTDHFAFVHMHKTGGQSINNALSVSLKNYQEVGYHYPFSLLPEQFAHLPLVGFVRNPWDWYVSWYAFNRQPKVQNPLFAICSNGGSADFKTSVTNLLQLGDDSVASQQYRDALVSILPNTLDGNRGLGLTKNCIANFSSNETGYYSWLFHRMIGAAKAEQVHVGKFENLDSDLIDILSELNVPEAPDIARALGNTPRTNSSKHGHYSQYYDTELAELLGRKDKKLIDRFGYEFESQAGPSTIVELPSTYAIDGAFKKLSGKAKNYLLLRSDLELAALTEMVSRMPDDHWARFGPANRHKSVAQPQMLLLIFNKDLRHKNPTYLNEFRLLEQEMTPLLECVANIYENEGHVIRAFFTKLLPGESVAARTNTAFSLLHSHRIYLPIETNNDVSVIVGGERKYMQVGEMWEINNATVHNIENRGDTAHIHLVVDWVPDSTSPSAAQ